MSRTTVYCAVSTLVSLAVVVNAFEARPNFFSAAMYLSQSSACLMVLTNMFLVLTLVSGKVLQTLFFGRLRAIEVEHLYERAWYAVTESCLAMTIFRDEFDTRFFLFFTLLLATKIFHWLAQDRIEYMEQTTEVARTFHIRMSSIIGCLLAADLVMVSFCMRRVFATGPNVMIMFAFEFAILAATILAVAGKYCLNLVEARYTETWDNKSAYVFYLELLTDFIKLVTYVAFFATIMTFYGIPLHIVRDLYVTLRSFTTKCRNFMRFRRATQDMDARYPNATVAELDATGDKTCIVCREDMVHASHPIPENEPAHNALDNPKKLPCGHILHFRCLRSWLERQQSCPMCRRPVLEDDNASARTQTGTATEPARQPPQPELNPPPNVPHGDNRHASENRPNPLTHSHNPQVHLPDQNGMNPVQLPRGFQLPPGWALLPVSTAPPQQPYPPIRSDHGSIGSESTPAPSDRPTTGSNPAQGELQSRLPPVIPLFHAFNPALPDSVLLPPELSDEQIASMETSTRRTIEERLRILNEVQARVSEGLTMLTRLRDVARPTPSTPPSSSEEERPDPSLQVDTAPSGAPAADHLQRADTASEGEMGDLVSPVSGEAQESSGESTTVALL